MISAIINIFTWLFSIINGLFNIRIPLSDTVSISVGGLWLFLGILLLLPSIIKLFINIVKKRRAGGSTD